jgi:hypothetical protein
VVYECRQSSAARTEVVPAGLEWAGGRSSAGGNLGHLPTAEGGRRLDRSWIGDFELRYLRDKQKREVDFVVVKDRVPRFLVEVRLSETSLSPSLAYFEAQTKAAHAF